MFASDESMTVIGMGAMLDPIWIIGGLIAIVINLVFWGLVLVLVGGVFVVVIRFALRANRSRRSERKSKVIPLVGPRPKQ